MTETEIKPVYVLNGSDNFLRDHHRKRIISDIIGDADPQTAVSSFDATAELAQVLDELRTLPFLAPRRVVIIQDAEAFISAFRESLENYLNNPSSASSLILTVSSWPKNTRLAKLAAGIGETIDCSTPEKKNLPAWLRKVSAKHQKTMAPDAIELLVEWRGEDLASLENEMEKLTLYVGNRDTITANDVGLLVTSTAGAGAFELTNAITVGNPAAALKALASSLTQRGEEFKMLGLLAWHLRKALSVQQAIDRGEAPSQACKSARVFFQQQEFLNMLRRRGRKKLQDDFRKLLAADLAMKTGADPIAALQELVVRLCA
jgi:DNA polymerase-3 subunit delta